VFNTIIEWMFPKRMHNKSVFSVQVDNTGGCTRVYIRQDNKLVGVVRGYYAAEKALDRLEAGL